MKGNSENEPLGKIQWRRRGARLLAGHDRDAWGAHPDRNVHTISKGK
jgi:hypothetical protein